jgi:hypothetical protein
MGAPIGGILGIIFALVSVVVGLFAGVFWGATTLNVIAYLILLWVVIAIHFTAPQSKMLLTILGPHLRPPFKAYHLYIRFPAACTLLCGIINVLRIALFVWGAVAAWQGHYVLAGVSIAYSLATALYVTRLDPNAFFAGPASKGHSVARDQLADIERIRDLYENLSAIERRG